MSTILLTLLHRARALESALHSVIRGKHVRTPRRTFQLRIDVDRSRDARTVPPARLELPTALVLERCHCVRQYDHSTRYIETHVELRRRQIRRASADQLRSEGAREFEAAAQEKPVK